MRPRRGAQRTAGRAHPSRRPGAPPPRPSPVVGSPPCPSWPCHAPPRRALLLLLPARRRSLARSLARMLAPPGGAMLRRRTPCAVCRARLTTRTLPGPACSCSCVRAPTRARMLLGCARRRAAPQPAQRGPRRRLTCGVPACRWFSIAFRDSGSSSSNTTTRTGGARHDAAARARGIETPRQHLCGIDRALLCLSSPHLASVQGQAAGACVPRGAWGLCSLTVEHGPLQTQGVAVAGCSPACLAARGSVAVGRTERRAS